MTKYNRDSLPLSEKLACRFTDLLKYEQFSSKNDLQFAGSKFIVFLCNRYFKMDSEIKIYMNDRIVVLTDKDIEKSAMINGKIDVFKNKKTLAKRLKRFEESEDQCLYIVHSDLDKLLGHVAGCFKYIEAAGGLVTYIDGRILMIERFGKWDLPKGKSEKGESLQKTAIREVMEECGLKTAPEITGELTHTFHTCRRNGKHILKHTAWFSMKYNGDDALQPQSDEDITRAEWFHQSSLDAVFQNTYDSIKQVINSYMIKVSGFSKDQKNQH